MRVMNDFDEESFLDKTLTKKLFDKNSSTLLKKQRSSTADKRDKIKRKTSQIPLTPPSPKQNFILMNKRIVARKPIQNNFMYHNNTLSNIRDTKNKDNDKNPKSMLDDSIQSIKSMKSMLTQNNFSFIEHDSFQSDYLKTNLN